MPLVENHQLELILLCCSAALSFQQRKSDIINTIFIYLDSLLFDYPLSMSPKPTGYNYIQKDATFFSCLFLPDWNKGGLLELQEHPCLKVECFYMPQCQAWLGSCDVRSCRENISLFFFSLTFVKGTPIENSSSTPDGDQ